MYEALHLAAAVAPLALDERAGRGVDRLDPVELREHAVLGGPEADRQRDRAGERLVGIREADGLAQVAQRRVDGERVADRVDQVEP